MHYMLIEAQACRIICLLNIKPVYEQSACTENYFHEKFMGNLSAVNCTAYWLWRFLFCLHFMLIKAQACIKAGRACTEKN